MSGHSKWATTKHKKAAADAKRGKLFTKLTKEITVAAKMGGGSPEGNPRLRTAVAKAKAVSMPAENIQRAIKKGTGELPGVSYEEVTYEGYGPGGVAVLVEVLTDNKNRTVSEVRHLFTRNNGNLGEAGSVGWMFQQRGYFVFPKSDVSEDRLMEVALEAGADDVKSEDTDQFEVLTAPPAFERVRKAFDEAGLKYQVAELTMIPQTYVRLEGKQAEQMMRLMNALEDSDDVQNVYANFDIPDEVMEAAVHS
jgi:YebC/PmpR family DNA-binding regulatory protein